MLLNYKIYFKYLGLYKKKEYFIFINIILSIINKSNKLKSFKHYKYIIKLSV